ncbi:MAG: hypothetical protein LQ343_000136 [Gyalolechia ehrenbergii]|nr:MAG: hypothetical protein LQ343_000136 [Gyalolechia ehrenbergii]
MRETPGAFPSTPGEPASSPPESSQLSLSQAVWKRKAEYTVPRKIRIKIGTWNVAALPGTEKDIGSWFVYGKGISESLSILSFGDKTGSEDFEDVGHQEARRSKKRSTTPLHDTGLVPGGDDIGLYVLGLQEIVDISSAAEALKPYNDPHPSRKWKRAVEDALPPGYVKVAEQQLVGLYMVIYAAPAIAPTVSSVSTTSVGTGLMGYMGNKGAVIARIVLGESTSLLFVDCHLGAGVEKGSLERRNWDASQVLSRARLDPIYNSGGELEEGSDSIGHEDFAFWFGDLNYRLEDLPGDDVRRLLMLHTKNEYRVDEPSKRKIDAELALSAPDPTDKDNIFQASSSIHSTSSINTSTTLRASEQLDPSLDPASLKTTLESLLPHDQLHAQMRSRKAFHDGWREGPIDFLPTYKYDVGSVGMFDSSEKKRGPSWCDRILFRTRKDKQAYEQKVKEEETARKRDQEMKAHGIDDPAVNEEEVLFDYDPANDGVDDEYDPDADTEDQEKIPPDASPADRLHLEYYTSHQRVLSSDHKPLDATFTLIYDAVDPDLKAKVHQEVARELDRAENERRPAVTVIVDHHTENQSNSNSSTNHEGVDFGDIRFDNPKTRNITIANTGRVPASIGFTDRVVLADQSAGAAPPWLRYHFDRPNDKTSSSSDSQDVYTLEPGDAANVELVAHVKDINLVRLLNKGTAHLEDVLVLRVNNGRDYFLPVRATWLPSSFGRSIDNLNTIPEGGVRKLQYQSSNQDTAGVKWSAPREIFRLTEAVEHLIERVVAEWGMRSAMDERPPWENDIGWPFSFSETDRDRDEIVPGDKLEFQVREALDCDTPILESFSADTPSTDRLQAVARTLLSFLQSLEDGIITKDLWAELEASFIAREQATPPLSMSVEEEKLEILDVMTKIPARSTAFTFLVGMLGKVVREIESAVQEGEKSAPSRKLLDAYLDLFVDLLVPAPFLLGGPSPSASASAKERKIRMGRRRRVVEVFFQG